MTSTIAQRPDSMERPPVSDILDRLDRVTRNAGRTDLISRLSDARARFDDSSIRVVLAGEAHAGSSSLVNALLGEDASGPEVTVSHSLLGSGIVLVDTPGVTSRNPSRAMMALSQAPTADVVLFVTDASQEFTAPELDLLRQIQQLCPFVVCVLTKIDLYPRWRDIQAANRRHLTTVGLGLPIIPVSADLKSAATRYDDADLEVESGFPQLLDFMRRHVVERRDHLAKAALLSDIGTVTDHLSLSVAGELDATNDPARGAAVVDRLQKARVAADSLRQRTSSWQYTLTDGSVELMTDIEHDLRERLRAVVRDAEEDIKKSDPAPRWSEFEAWLNQQVSMAVRGNFVMAHTRSVELAGRVASRFADDGAINLPDINIDDTTSVLEPVTTLEGLDSGKAGMVQRVISSMRGSYGGILMVGLATSLMGLALVNPFSIGAGVLLGANTFREDRKNRTLRRQAEAKIAVAKLMDDVVFQVNKESKQRLRDVQRLLRDHFTATATDMLRSVDQSLARAKAAVTTHEDARAHQVATLQSAITEIRSIRTDAVEWSAAS